MTETTMTRTRQSIGSQLREVLDDMVAKKALDSWSLYSREGGRGGYYLTRPHVFFPLFTAGELMDWLNERGYDIRFGKA